VTYPSKFRCPDAACPYCGRVNAYSFGLTTPDPEPGDVTICGYCASCGIYTDEFLIRVPTAEEQVYLDDAPDVQAARWAVLESIKRRG
jgi:hypothetical protein